MLFQPLFLCWVLWLVSPLRVESQFPIVLDISSIDVQSHMFWGFSLWCRSLGLRYLMRGTNLSLLRENLQIMKYLPSEGCHIRVGHLSFLSAFMWSCYPSLQRSCSPCFKAFVRGNFSICSCRVVISMAGREFRIFSCCYLELPLPPLMIGLTCSSSWEHTWHLI